MNNMMKSIGEILFLHWYLRFTGWTHSDNPYFASGLYTLSRKKLPDNFLRNKEIPGTTKQHNAYTLQ